LKAWTRGSTCTTRCAASRDRTCACSSQTAPSGRRKRTTCGTSSRTWGRTSCASSLEYCLTYAEQVWQHGFPSLVVLGGDRTIGRPRCVEHAWKLREEIRAREPRLTLGGWANPYGNPEQQVDYLLDDCFTGEYYLTQVVSHLTMAPVERFVTEARRRQVQVPGLFGVFYYRSANPRTLEALRDFLPVPAEGLIAEFAAGATPVEVCARTLRAMMDIGVRHFYISNLPLARATSTLNAILERVGVTA
jgi:hypothetical protein